MQHETQDNLTGCPALGNPDSAKPKGGPSALASLFGQAAHGGFVLSAFHPGLGRGDHIGGTVSRRPRGSGGSLLDLAALCRSFFEHQSGETAKPKGGSTMEQLHSLPRPTDDPIIAVFASSDALNELADSLDRDHRHGLALILRGISRTLVDAGEELDDAMPENVSKRTQEDFEEGSRHTTSEGGA